MIRIALGMLTVAAASGIAAGDTTTTTTDQEVAELRQLVSELRDEIDTLKRTDDEWLAEARAEEIQALVQDVLADADTRASLLQSSVTAGYDKKFFLASADGSFRLNIGGQVQVRYVYNNQDEGTDGANTIDANRSGFEVRRAKLDFSGHVVDPSWTFRVKGGYNRVGGDLITEDVWIAKSFDNGWAVRAGQFKAPFMREELVSSSKQLAVDRSLLNERWNQDRSIGVQLSWKSEKFRVAGMYHDGLGVNRFVDFRSRRAGWDDENTEFAFATRAEMLLAGDWKQFGDFSGWQGGELGVMIGAALSYQKQEYGTDGDALLPQVPPGVDNEIEDIRLTADVSVEGDGWNAFAAFVYVDLDNDASGADEIDISPWGFVLQGGFFLTEDWEPFLRYEFSDADADDAEDLNIITVGVNRYFNKHGLKWTTDVGFALDGVTSPFGASSVGWRRDLEGEDGQIVFRSQLQLLF
jgi:hypothetical protein